MITTKLSVLFFVAKAKMNKQGNCPIKCRITYLKRRREFATGIFIAPDSWSSKNQHLIDKEATENGMISLIKQKINQAFLFLQLEGKEFDVDDIYSKYNGDKPKEQKTVMEVINHHNNRMEKLIGVETTFTSWEKYAQTKKHIEDFLKFKYNRSDYPLMKLNESFLQEFEFYLKTEKKFKQSTIYKSIQRLRKMIKMAIALNYLQKDPFMLYRAKRYKKEIIYLTMKELTNLRNQSFKQQRLNQVRDLFVFSCYTGLAYKELSNLKSSNIIKYEEDEWIEMKRQKTGNMIQVPLLPIPLEILKRYSNEDNLLPVISNQKYNSYLKEIGAIAGIDKTLTTHIARKTFATTILLSNDVPMEVVSKLLGHSNINTTTESYGEVVKTKIKEYMNDLSTKLRKQ